MGTALGLLAEDGVTVLFGVSGGADVTLNAQRFFATGGASLYGLILFHELRRESAAVGLQRLLSLVETGQLRPQIDNVSLLGECRGKWFL